MANMSIGQDIVVEVAGEHSLIEISSPNVTVAAESSSPSVAEAGDMKAVQKSAYKVALLSIGVSAIWAVGTISGGTLANAACSRQKSSPQDYYNNQYLVSNAYAVVSFMSFEVGIVLLLFSILLPQMPGIMGVAKKLVWVAFLLVHMAVGLKIISSNTHVTC